MMEIAVIVLSVVVVVLCVCLIVSRNGGRRERIETVQKPMPSERETAEKEILPYHFKYLLTRNEWSFYRKLRPIAAKYGLCILAKVRLADLVDVDAYLTGNGFYKYFNKIMAKHVDFVLCNPENLAVKLILELDDSTHNATAERASRDDFVDKVLTKCGYVIVHTYGGANLDELLGRLLGKN